MSAPPLPATTPLYHAAQPVLSMRARVLAAQGEEVALNATAFYPAGGGQPDDTGVLRWEGGEARVVATRKDDQGVVWHRLAGGGVPAVGEEVGGEVDAGRRWRHMQRHSGEHLLAQAFTRVSPAFEVAAVSMAGPACTLDLRGDPGPADVQAAQRLLARVLGREVLRLRVPVVEQGDLGHYPLRRETKVQGDVRLVIFGPEDGPAFDVSACGGTHVPVASLCLPVVVLRTERVRGGLTRVVFMAGEEASEFLTGTYEAARTLAQSLSVPVEALGERVEALREEAAALGAQLERMRAQLALAEVAQAPALALPSGGELRLLRLTDPALLLPALQGMNPQEVRVAVTPEGRCAVASAHPTHDAAALLRAALALAGGRGGGRPDLAQGQTPDPDAFVAALAHALGVHGPVT